MNVNTYDTTPVLDEVVSFPSKAHKVRVFNDGSKLFPLWFELTPDCWWVGRNEENARNTRSIHPDALVGFDTLTKHYPEGKLVHE